MVSEGGTFKERSMNSRTEAVIFLARRYGYSAKEVLLETEDHTVLLATRGKQDVILKGASDQAALNLHNELEANSFLRDLNPTCAVFPLTTFVTQVEQLTLIEREYLEGRVFADKTPHKLHVPRRTEDLEDIFQTMLFLHQIPRERVPAIFLRRATDEFSLSHIIERQRDYLTKAVEAELITLDEAIQLMEIVRDGGDLRRFVHHDIQFSNLVRLADGRLGLFDAEFARWGMKWYDVAYAFLQSEVLYGDTAVARTQLRYNVVNFMGALPTESICTEIFVPLAYRLSANLMLAAKDPTQHERARRVLECVLAHNLDKLASS
jgi:thiamine kinase-like enzyme